LTRKVCTNDWEKVESPEKGVNNFATPPQHQKEKKVCITRQVKKNMRDRAVWMWGKPYGTKNKCCFPVRGLGNKGVGRGSGGRKKVHKNKGSPGKKRCLVMGGGVAVPPKKVKPQSQGGVNLGGEI